MVVVVVDDDVRSLPGVEVLLPMVVLRVLLLLLLLSPLRVMSVEPPKHPNFFVGLGVVLLAAVLLLSSFDVVSIVRVLDLDLADDDDDVLLSTAKVLLVVSLPRDLVLADDDDPS